MAIWNPITGLLATIRGIVLGKALDTLAAGEWLILKNVRQYRANEIRQRPGIVQLNATPMFDLNVHSVCTMTDPISGLTVTFVGAGTHVYIGTGVQPTAFTLVDSGYSGNPLSMLTFRPNQSPSPYLYVADSLRMSRFSIAGVRQNWGIAPPTAPPTVAIAATELLTIDPGTALTGWSVDGTVFPSGDFSAATATATSTFMVYDTGSTGWLNVSFIASSAVWSDILPGIYAIINSGGGTQETLLVDSVYKAVPATTISSIHFDTGTTGLATIVLAAANPRHLVMNSLLSIGPNGASQTDTVIVQSVTVGPDSSISLRCSLPHTHVSGETVTGQKSFRVYASNTHAASEVITITFLDAGSEANPNGVGTISKSISIDLSTISGRAVQDTDYIELYLSISVPASLVEAQLMFDINGGTFENDYFYAAVRPDDFTGSVTMATTTLTARQRRLQRQQVDDAKVALRKQDLTVPDYYRLKRNLTALSAAMGKHGKAFKHKTIDPIEQPPGPGSTETIAGTAGFNCLKIPIGSFTRVGQNLSLGWANVGAVRLAINLNGATVSVIFQGMTLVGSYGPTVASTEAAYQYCYRWYNSNVGARSYPSPATRTGVTPTNQRVAVTIPSAPDSQTNQAEVFRFGGSLSEWLQVGTVPPNTVFNDDYPDLIIANNTPLQFNQFQPFPVIDAPHAGVCDVVGTSITATSGTFNTSWSAGSLIIINNITYTLYAPPDSTSHLTTVENVGNFPAGVPWLVPAATIFGQPVASVAGPYGLGEFGYVMMAVGTSLQADTLFWTNPNDSDSASDTNNLSLTSPSEQLQAVTAYEGRVVVFSTERAFLTRPSTNPVDGTLTFNADEIPNAKGLWSPWGYCVTPNGIPFIGPDGVYITTGDAPQLLSGDLYPVLPHDGQPGVTITEGSIAPIDFTQIAALRLSYVDQRIYFCCVDINGQRQSLVLNPTLGGWESQDIYTPAINYHYAPDVADAHTMLMLATDGRVYAYSTASTEDVVCEVRTGAIGNPRMQTLFGDFSIDINVNSTVITAAIFLDDFTISGTALGGSPFFSSFNKRGLFVIDINAGSGVRCRNVIFDLSWSGSNTVYLYGIEPSAVQKQVISFLRGTDVTDCGHSGAKFMQGVTLRADTFNLPRTITVLGDNGLNGVLQLNDTITVQQNGESRMSYSFATPFIAHLVQLLPTDSSTWLLFDDIEWHFNPAPPLVQNWITQETTHNFPGYGHDRDYEIAYVATAAINFTVTISGVAYPYTLPAPAVVGQYLKSYLVPQAVKGKNWKYALNTSVAGTGFRLFEKDCMVRATAWGGDDYQGFRPFGGDSRTEGREAAI
jgi:hypothetical protein